MNRKGYEWVTVEGVIDFLNELVKLDKLALERVMLHRVPCNNALADHPTVQVGYGPPGSLPPWEVGMLGILNGLFGVSGDGYGFITAVIDNDGERPIEFVRTKPELYRQQEE